MLVGLLSGFFGVKKSSVKIVNSMKSKNKVIEIAD